MMDEHADESAHDDARLDVAKDAVTNQNFAPMRSNQDFLRTVAQ